MTDVKEPEPVEVGWCPVCELPIYVGEHCLFTEAGIIHQACAP